MTDSIEPFERTTTVRRAEPRDARLLGQLGARLFEEAFGKANDPADMRDYLATAFSVERQSAELDSNDVVIWLAEDDGRAAVGYAALERGGTADGVTGVRTAEVQRLYVDGTWHGRGVGEALMGSCVAQARAWHCDEIWLGVWERNPRAIAFYQKSGFRAVGAQTFTLGGEIQQDLVMVKALS